MIEVMYHGRITVVICEAQTETFRFRQQLLSKR